MSEEDIKRNKELIEILKRRKHEREKQHATLGVLADPSISIETEDIRKTIERLEKEIADWRNTKINIVLSTDNTQANNPQVIDPEHSGLLEYIAKLPLVERSEVTDVEITKSYFVEPYKSQDLGVIFPSQKSLSSKTIAAITDKYGGVYKVYVDSLRILGNMNNSFMVDLNHINIKSVRTLNLTSNWDIYFTAEVTLLDGSFIKGSLFRAGEISLLGESDHMKLNRTFSDIRHIEILE